MNEQEQLNFCPKCGAHLNNGVCQSCGYEAQKQGEQIDNVIYNAPDVYQTQVDQDIYQPPQSGTEVAPLASGGRFSGVQPAYEGADNAGGVYESSSYPNTSNAYGNAQFSNAGNTYNSYDNSHYPNTSNAYGNSQFSNAGNAYNSYDSNQYPNTENTYGNSQFSNTGNAHNSYESNQYPNTVNAYGNGQFSSAGNAYNPYGNSQYQNGANTYNNSQYYDSGNNYGKNQYRSSNPYNSNPYAPDYGYSNPYSPYAAPQKNKHTGLIIGVIIAAVVLFLIALFALLYHVFDALTEAENNDRYGALDDYYNDYYDDYFYNYDDDYFYNYDDYGYGYGDNYGYGYGYGDNYGYGYDDNYGYDYDFNHDFSHGYGDNFDYDAEEYYILHDDIKEGLPYTIDRKEYNYDTKDKNVSIRVDYPVIAGENIPNLDKLNEAIENEVTVITEYYEKDYSKYMLDEDDYFIADSEGYVTYMSEEVLSIAFSEYIYSDYYNLVNLYCINIDMKDGVILDNTGIIDVNDDFSVDFRKRSDTQNGTISSLTRMTDQEITKYLTTEDNLIIFYTPQGMEIGFNYSDGWVTVTYKDYEDFLKIF